MTPVGGLKEPDMAEATEHTHKVGLKVFSNSSDCYKSVQWNSVNIRFLY